MLQARELTADVTSTHVILAPVNDYSWNGRSMSLILGNKTLFLSPSKKILLVGFHPQQNLHHNWLGPRYHIFALSGSVRKANGTYVTWGCPPPSPLPALGEGESKLLPHTKCLNSAERLPLLDSSMFITFVFVPRMLNFRDLNHRRKTSHKRWLSGQRTKLD